MTASLRRRRRSSAAAPLEDDDLLSEILLRLPPQPSSLPRASLVCKRWRCLASDPGFRRRFRIHHRRNPPLLGCFVTDLHRRRLSFVSTLEAPNRVPFCRLSLQLGNGDRFRLLNCRHGLLLMYIASWKQILVWDPVTADQHRLAVPPGFDFDFVPVIHLVRAAGADHFQVVLVGTDKQQKRGAIACVYSSETRILTVIRLSEDMFAKKNCQFLIMRAEGGGLGYLFLSNYNAQLWKRKNGYDGVASWVLERSIELDKLLSLNPEEKDSPIILGIAEHKNLVFMWTVTGLFTVQLESLEFKESFETNC